MRKTNLQIFMIIVLAIIISFIGVYKYNKNTIVVIDTDKTFIFSKGQDQLIDINNDNIPDFKCTSKPSGNRFHQLIVPLDKKNKIIRSKDILKTEELIDDHIVFSEQFNFNDLGNGEHADITNKYIGVKFQINNYSHYGWIKFSSYVKGNTTKNTPIYYQKIVFHIQETAYNKRCEQPLSIK